MNKPKKNNEEQKALEEIKKIEKELQERLSLARKKAREIISGAQIQAAGIIREKELKLAGLKRAAEQDISTAPEMDIKPDQGSAHSPLVKELAGELFDLVIGKKTIF